MEEAKSTYPLIHNKVTSPRYVTPTLRRGRLLDWLNAHAEARAIVIAAGAGYGKTTLLWQWEREAAFPCFWYKLDRNDRDWTLHISYLVEAVSQQYSGFGRRAHSILRQMGGPGSSRPGVTAFLLAEMHERIREPTTFIIDDWQYVASVTEVRGLWNQILRDAPPTCRFVFASRGKPQLQFARFKTHGGYAELRTDDLRVTQKELTELFRDVYHNPLTADEAAELERRTEGWAVGLQLVQVSLRDRKTPEDRRALIESLTKESESDLFSFLAEEVLDQQTEETRNFLLATSILHQISADIAERLAGVHDGMGQLLVLELSGLFTYRLDERHFRYHGLFREFLERRLIDDRSEAEIIGLHIHAASYFETTEQWPHAIYHYLKAGLQRQAARLIARNGEGVVAEGRLGLVDEWLQQLPPKTIHDNARLSLLHGEALGLRGEWDQALQALERARLYFLKKQDRRMHALALMKQSSVQLMWGRTREAARLAELGLDLAPESDMPLRVRLRGNLALTRSYLENHLSETAAELERIIADSLANGLEHFAAVGFHNLGVVLRESGRLNDSYSVLDRATKFWAQETMSPYADNCEIVQTLLYLGDTKQALEFAKAGVAKTRPWKRAYGEALLGEGLVFLVQGKWQRAEERFNEVLRSSDAGAVTEGAATAEIDRLVLSGSEPRAVREAARHLDRQLDERLEATTQVAFALAGHHASRCQGDCYQEARRVLARWRARGARLLAVVGEIKLLPQRFAHDDGVAATDAVLNLQIAKDLGLFPALRMWIRRLVPHADALARVAGGPDMLAAVMSADPEYWRDRCASLLRSVPQSDRASLIATISRVGTKYTAELLTPSLGPDIAAAKTHLIRSHSPRLFIRSFGALGVHVGRWDGKQIPMAKRRLRALLSLLVARADEDLSRDMVLDLLWPEADPPSAINNLNQTVFQLRRTLDPEYRDGASANYIISSIDSVVLDPELVRTDLDEVRRELALLESSDRETQRKAALRAFDFIRGQFLAESRYDDWATNIRTRVHAEIRHHLDRIAKGQILPMDYQIALRSASVMALLDEWDESAQLALVRNFAACGQWRRAEEVADGFREKLHGELDDQPSASFEAALKEIFVHKDLIRAAGSSQGG